jgi:uncharacterized protein YjbI with pentapeptide repeats
MANEDQLRILKQGREAWNDWRTKTGDISVDLRKADLSGRDLLGANLSDANLSEADLHGANLREADLSRALLSQARLSGAYFSRADLHGADLRKANLCGANYLRLANLNEANLSDADLRGAHLSDANLRGADLSGADLSQAYLSRADLHGADLRKANLSKALLSPSTNLSRANLSDANLSGANLSGANLSDADLRGANLSDAGLSGANLSRALLSHANLSGAYLNRADLSGADLSGANLCGADLRGADLSDIDLSEANLSGADLRDVDPRDEMTVRAAGAAGPADYEPPVQAMPASSGPPGQATPRLPPPPEAEPVDAAVFCPPSVAPRSEFLVQVFLYPPPAAAAVEAESQQRDPTATERGRYSLPIDVPRGTRIDVRLEMPLLRVDEADAVVVWRGVPTAVQFDVSVPAVVESPTAIGRVRFAIAAVPAGTLRFQVALTFAASRPLEFREAQATRYRRAFVSYSSQDRAEVLRRVQAFKISGMSVFQDILDLDPGERWERALYHEIDRCDVFLLFWSKAAAASEWVSKEIDYALERQGGNVENPPAIQPVPIEGPPIAPPPPRLAGLHFNDALLAQINLEAQLRDASTKLPEGLARPAHWPDPAPESPH